MVAGINHRRMLIGAALMAASAYSPVVVDVKAARRRREAEEHDAMLADVSNAVLPAVDVLPVVSRPAPDSRGMAALSKAEAKRARRNAKRASSPSSLIGEQ